MSDQTRIVHVNLLAEPPIVIWSNGDAMPTRRALALELAGRLMRQHEDTP